MQNQKSIVISYQMGKVASSSICKSIPGCIQTHSLSPEGPTKYFSARYTGSLSGYILHNIRWRYRFWKTDRKLQKALKDKQKIKILIGVREPLSRNISGYFQSLTHRESGSSIEQHIHRFYAFCPHLAALTWFENEMLDYFGIDVYQHPFDQKSGFTLIKKDNVECFLYKFEKLASLEESLGEFLEVDDFKLSRTNESKNKWTNSVSSEFKKNLKPSKEYLNLLYSSKYARHFYSDSEICELRSKWNTT